MPSATGGDFPKNRVVEAKGRMTPVPIIVLIG